MKSRWTSWLLAILRYGLCAAAIVYLYLNVSWYDYATLAGPAPVRVRVMEERAAELVVRVDGQLQTLPFERFVFAPGETSPDIARGMRNVVLGGDMSQAVLAILVFGPVPFLAALRLIWMLAIQDVRLRFWDAVKLTFAGNFFNFALPGTTGGDLIKAYYITKHTHHKTEAVTTIFLDRVIGLLGLMALATAILVFAWQTVPWPEEDRRRLTYGLLAVWAALAVGAVIVFSSRLRGALGLSRFAESLPAGQHLLRIGRATVAMRRHKSLVLLSLAVTLMLQGIVVFSAFLMARALGMQGSAELYFICVPIGFLIAAVPIAPPQAIGVLEWAYIQFFTHDGLNSTGAAVTLALANRVIQLVWALPGILVPLLGAHLPSKSEIATLEEAEPT